MTERQKPEGTPSPEELKAQFPELDEELETSGAGKEFREKNDDVTLSEEEQETLTALKEGADLEDKEFSDVVAESESLDDIRRLLEANPGQAVPFRVLQERTQQALEHDRPQREVIERIDYLYRWLIDVGIEDQLHLIKVLAEQRLPDDALEDLLSIEQELDEIRGYTYALPRSIERAAQLLNPETHDD